MVDRLENREIIPLFTREELARAFGLLLPAHKASELAREWFEIFGDEGSVDGSGRYLYSNWRDHPSVREHVRSQPDAEIFVPATERLIGGTMYDWLLTMPHEKLEELLISFSDFHLDLVSLSSPDLRRRVELVRQEEPQISTERHCRELQAVLDRMNRL